MKQQKTRRAGRAAGEWGKSATANFSPFSTATEAQRARLLDALRRRPHNSHELRRMGIYWPAARVLELRKRSYEIDTHRVTLVDADGYAHKGCALYTLESEPEVQA